MRRVISLCCLGLLLAACKPPPAVFQQQLEARRLAAQLRVSVTSAADAGNRAVMADTDASSRQFADEARAHTREAEGARARLEAVGSSRVDLQACKLEYSIVSPK